MALERLEERAKEWGQPLATEIVAGVPHSDKELDHCGAIAGWTTAAPARCPRRLSQSANGRLAVASRDLAKLVQQPRLFGARGRAISMMERRGIFADALWTHDAS
jgi:hypothetical protein